MDIFSAADVHNAVASFNLASLHLSFDTDHLPFSDGIDPSILLDADPIERLGIELHNVPTPVLAHELSHMFQVAATPSGVRDFFEFFALEHVLGVAITDARQSISGSFPVGLHTLFGADSFPEPEAYWAARLAEQAFALRVGGLRFRMTDSTTPDSLAAGAPHSAFFVTVDDRGSSVAHVLGSRHIYEGIGAAVEILRSGNGRDLLGMTVDPYRVCLDYYLQARPQTAESFVDSLVEFTVVLDTALLEDQWYNGGTDVPSPGKAFTRIIEVLERHPDIALSSLERKSVSEFQNELMRLADFPIPDVAKICADLRGRLPGIVAEAKAISSIPGHILDWYERGIDAFQQFRLEYFDGACPVEVLAFGDRRWLEVLLTNVPSGSNGPELPIRQADTEYAHAFLWQQARHFRPVLEEMVFGCRPCFVQHACVLEERPACSGISDQLAAPDERCAREATIATAMSHWAIDDFDIPER